MNTVAHESFIGCEDIAERLQQSILDKYRSKCQKFRKGLCEKAYLTSEDERKHKHKNQCMVCKIEIDPGDLKTHKHHDWTIKPVIVADNKVIKGNYVGALCMNCDIKILERE